MKTLSIIECRHCGGSYFAGDVRITLIPGDENRLPDELAMLVRKIGRCTGCKEAEARTQGAKKKKYER